MTSSYLHDIFALLYIVRICYGCEPCFCYNETYQGITADCKWKNLTQLPQLEARVAQLHISYNDLDTLENVYNSTGFQSLNEFWADSSRIYNITPGAFNGLNNLSKLVLRYNFIDNLEQDMFEGLDNLRELRLEGNMIQTIESNVFSFLTNLICLQLDNNNIYEISNITFQGLNNLESLSLAYNFISELDPQIFHDLHNLANLKLNKNNLTNLDVKIFEKQVKLQCLQLNDNFIKKMSPCVFSNLINVKHINIGNNLLINLEFLKNKHNGLKGSQCASEISSETLSKLIIIKLSGNKLQNINHEEFKHLSNLKLIDLSSNALTELNPSTFIYNSQLNSLHLSNNPKLEILKKVPILNSTVLKVLNLSHCRIRELSKTVFQYLPQLKEIYLDNNLLNSFNKNIIMNLKNLTQVTLFNNPLICSCDLKETHEWFGEQNISVTDTKPHCLKSEHNTRKTWNEFKKIKCESVFYVTLKHVIEPTVFATIFLLGTIGTGALILIFCYYERVLQTPNSCIFSMALGDFIIVMVFLPMNYTFSFTTTWKFGVGMCKVFMFIRDLIIGLTIFSVLMLSFHRYTFNSFKLKKRNIAFDSYSKTAILHLFVIWFMAICLSSPALISAAIDDESCTYAIERTGLTFIHRVTITQFIVYIILPLCFIGLMHFITRRHVKLQSLILPEKVNNERAKARKEVIRNVLALTLVILISYMPDLLIRILIGWSVINRSSDSVVFIIFLTECLYFSNAWLNPLAFYLTCDDYKNYFRRIMFCERFRKRSFKRKPTPAYTVSSGISDQQHSSIVELHF